MVELRVLKKREVKAKKAEKIREPSIHRVFQIMKERALGKPWKSMVVNSEKASLVFEGVSAEISFPEGSVKGFDVTTRIKGSDQREKTRVSFTGLELGDGVSHTYQADPDQEIEVLLGQQRCTSLFIRDSNHGFIKVDTEGIAFTEAPYSQAKIQFSEVPTSVTLTIGNETTVFEIKQNTRVLP